MDLMKTINILNQHLQNVELEMSLYKAETMSLNWNKSNDYTSTESIIKMQDMELILTSNTSVSVSFITKIMKGIMKLNIEWTVLAEALSDITCC